MKLNIVVNMAVEPQQLERLRALPGASVTVMPERQDAYELPEELAAETHILFCTIAPTNLSAMRSLKWIQIGSAGYSQLLPLGLPERGIRACNALGVFDTAIAEWNVAMMINLARDLRGMIRHQEAGIWDRSARFQREIRGSVAGIWGYGGIGRETARLLKLMGIRVHVLVRESVKRRDAQYVVPGAGDPDGTLPDRVFTAGRELEFLGGLDFLIMALPITPRTQGIVGERELAALKPHAYVLNPARGPLIREEALLAALREQRIAGAALDTHYHYPMPPDHPLWRFPNVIMTPHISGSSLSPFFLTRVWDVFVGNVERHLQGEPLLNELSAAQLQGE